MPRLLNKGLGRRRFSQDPETFGSTSLELAYIDLTGTGKNVHEAKRTANLISAENKGVALLSDFGEEETEQSKSLRSRQRSVPSMLVQKKALAPKKEAKDTLKTKGGTRQKPVCDNTVQSHSKTSRGFDDYLDDISEDSVVSGPSSPHSVSASQMCSECEKLFLKMRKQGASRTKKRTHDPASLQCDQWLLNKAWRPCKWRHMRGKLWVHLKRIRKTAAERSNTGVISSMWPFCSRPHVFLQRNLRRCQETLNMSSGLSSSKMKQHHLRRRRAKAAWPPIGMRCQRPKKRKHLLTLDIPASAMNDNPPAVDDALHCGSQKRDKIQKHLTDDAIVSLNKQADCDDLQGTHKVLKCDNTLGTVSIKKCKQRCGESTERKLRKTQAAFSGERWDHSHKSEKVLSQGMCELSTAADASKCESVAVANSSSFLRSSGLFPLGVQKGSFKSMLAAFEKNQNQIIKEFH